MKKEMFPNAPSCTTALHGIVVNQAIATELIHKKLSVLEGMGVAESVIEQERQGLDARFSDFKKAYDSNLVRVKCAAQVLVQETVVKAVCYQQNCPFYPDGPGTVAEIS